MASSTQQSRSTGRGAFIRTVLITAAVALIAAVGIGTASAQDTSGGIRGLAPAGATVSVMGNNGVDRHTTVESDGHYHINHMPFGMYKVTVTRNGKVTGQRSVRVGLGSRKVDFACPHDQCAASDTTSK